MARTESGITYRRTRKLDLGQLERLWRSVGWWAQDSPSLLQGAFAHSSAVVSAWDGDRLVGVCNALSDGHIVVYYPYLVVDPEYQRRGIGTKLIGLMQERYGAFHQQVLLSAPDAVPFYERLGWDTSRAPGMQINRDA